MGEKTPATVPGTSVIQEAEEQAAGASCRAMAPPLDVAAAASALQLILECGGGGTAAEEEDKRKSGKKKKRKEKAGAQRITGWGLREFSKIVCKKVEAKGRTTYNEVADEIFTELRSMSHTGQEFDERNIRRRVYDAFNVLIAIRVIVKDNKEIIWMGLPTTRSEKTKKLEEVRTELVARIKNKKTFLQEIEKQFDDLQNLKLRNQALERSAQSAEGVTLPFLLVKTSPKATVEIEISPDTRFVHFDFNGTPFTLHDDVSILEGMRFHGAGRYDNQPKS